jgi:chromate transporter
MLRGPSDGPRSMSRAEVTLQEATMVWARVALLSFGGPAGQIAVMHRILVEEKRWIGEQRFLHALNYCMLLPGPEAQQLATYIGWLLHRTRGGIIAGGLFILPGIVSIMVLSWAYALFGNVGMVTALFFGLKSAVLAIVLDAMVRLGRRALFNKVMISLALLSFILVYAFAVPFPAIIVGAAATGYLGVRLGRSAGIQPHRHGAPGSVPDDDTLLGEELPLHARPSLGTTVRHLLAWLSLWTAPLACLLVLLGKGNVFTQIATFFSTMAVVTFGGAYAALAFVAQQAVATFQWLGPDEMLDGLGMAETTPGPLIMVLQFVGFMGAYRNPGALPPLLAGTLGGLLATWVTFVPCFLWIFLGAPYIERIRGNAALAGALSAITGAVVGVILNLAVWFAVHTLFREAYALRTGPLSLDLPVLASLRPWSLFLAVAATWAMLRLRTGMIATLAATSGAGMLLHAAGVAG